MFSETASNPLLKRSRKRQNWTVCLIAPLAVMLLLTTVYIIQGIWPFGSANISYADMAQGYIPRYYHLYDAMHGSKSLYFDWYTGTGVSLASNLSTFLSPINLLFYFVPRNLILESMSLFLMLRMALMSFTAFIFLNRVFPKLSTYFKIIFAIMYAFSGYVLQYYTNIMWLDTAILFPILIMTLLMLLEENRILPYLLTFTACLIISFYLSFMSTLFIIFSSGLYIFLLLPKEKIKKSIFNLGIGTIVPFFLTAAVIIPEVLHMSSSARTATGKSYFDIINVKMIFSDLPNLNKLFMLLGVELLIVLIIKFAFADKKFKRNKIFFFSLIALITAPIFLEGVNLIWHTGSYADFPLRFGFMISFVLIYASAFYLTNCCGNAVQKCPETMQSTNELCDTEVVGDSIVTSKAPPKSAVPVKVKALSFKDRIQKMVTVTRVFFILKIITILALITASIPLLGRIYKLFDQYGFYLLNRNNNQLYQNVIMVSVIYLIVIAIAFSIASKRIRNSVISVAVILPLMFYSVGLIGVKTRLNVEHDSSFIPKTLEMKDALPSEGNVLNRIKDSGVQLNTNYPMLLERSAISNWTHLIPDSLQTSLEKLGYSSVFTRTLDSGGSVFTDALLGIKNTVTLEDADPNLYNFNKKAGEFNYYDNKYTLPFGVMADKTILNNLPASVCEAQNAVYKSISGNSDDIIKKLISTANDTSKIINSQNISGGKSYTIQVKEKETLYFWSTSTNLTLSVNNEPIKIPTLNGPNNLTYKTYFNNKMIELGTFENAVVNVTLKSKTAINDNTVSFATLSLNKLEQLCKKLTPFDPNAKAGSSSLEMTVQNGTSENVLFVPVGFDKGWSCTVNGENTKIIKAATGFMAIELVDGVNTIKFNFTPVGLQLGLIISGISILCFASVCFLLIKKRKKGIEVPNIILIISKYTYIAVLVIAFFVVYIIPIGYSIYQTFK